MRSLWLVGLVVVVEFDAFTKTTPQTLTVKHAHQNLPLSRHQAVTRILGCPSFHSIPTLLKQSVGILPGQSSVQSIPIILDFDLMGLGIDELVEKLVFDCEGSEKGDGLGGGVIGGERQSRAIVPRLFKLQFL